MLGGVVPEVADIDGLLERLMECAVDDGDRFRRQAALLEADVEPLHHVGM